MVNNLKDEVLSKSKRKKNLKKAKGFAWFPKHMRKFKAVEANNLRDHLMIMMVCHCTFLAIELLVYNFSIMMIGSELVYLWICY